MLSQRVPFERKHEFDQVVSQTSQYKHVCRY